MENIIFKFLDEKYPESVTVGVSQSNSGMRALFFNIFCRRTNEKICKYTYYFETKKIHITPSPFLEVSLIGYFDIGICEIETIVGKWVASKIPISEDSFLLKANQQPL